MQVTRMLVPVDFSARSRAALRYAVEMARTTCAEIEVLHVVHPPNALHVAFDAYVGRPLPHASAVEVADAREQMDNLVSSVDHEGVSVHQRVEAGDPAATIARIAAEGAHDLILLGTHGRIGLAELVYGSVAKRLITCAPCPVVTLRAAPVA
jgi:nucleotide-binding universal stress UspA family protein